MYFSDSRLPSQPLWLPSFLLDLTLVLLLGLVVLGHWHEPWRPLISPVLAFSCQATAAEESLNGNMIGDHRQPAGLPTAFWLTSKLHWISW